MSSNSIKSKYTGISLPKKLVDEIEKVMIFRPELQYKSRAEFIKEAIRQKLQTIKF